MSLPTQKRPIPGFQTGYPIVAALDLLGRRWILRMLWELRAGPMGFRALQTLCDLMSPSLLSQRLSMLQTTGLIDHTEEGMYHLTEVGKALLQSLTPLQAWAQQWADQLRAQEETAPARSEQEHQERSRIPMPPVDTSQSTFTSAVPRLAVNDIDQSLAFYEQLGFQTVYHGAHFAIVKRDEVQLHLIHSPQVDPADNESACYLFVTHIEALYEQYVPTHAVHPRALLETKLYGIKEFAVIDPSGVRLIFAEPVPAEERSGIG